MANCIEKEEKQRQQVAKSLKSAMKNHPPKRQDMYKVLNKLKKAYPELLALKKPMDNLPDEISLDWWTIIPTYDIYTTVEKKLEMDPFDDDLAMDAFAYIMWLSTNLIFREELRNLAIQ